MSAEVVTLADADAVKLTGDDTLPVIAGKIKACLDRARNLRVTAGQLLAEARRRVDAGEAGDIRWEAWCKANVERSYRDVKRLLGIANAPDPEAAAEAAKVSRRVAIDRRHKDDTVSPPAEFVSEEDPTTTRAPKRPQPAGDTDSPQFHATVEAISQLRPIERAALLMPPYLNAVLAGEVDLLIAAAIGKRDRTIADLQARVTELETLLDAATAPAPQKPAEALEAPSVSNASPAASPAPAATTTDRFPPPPGVEKGGAAPGCKRGRVGCYTSCRDTGRCVAAVGGVRRQEAVA